MAVYVPGIACALCNLPILAIDEAVLFSPFVVNGRDPLFKFHDAVVHEVCLRNDPLGEHALELQATASRVAGEHRCALCGLRIVNPDDQLPSGLLASDRRDPLYEFNFLEFHRDHLRDWTRYEEFKSAVENAQQSERWDGPRLVFQAGPRTDVRWIEG
jgi:hypothetical protein